MGRIRLWSGPPNLRKFKEGGTQSYNEGDLVKLSSGKIVIATDGNDVAGVAAKKAKGTVNSDAFVYVITPEQVWSVYTTGTPTTANIGVGYDFTPFTTLLQTLSLSVTSNKDAIVQALDPRDTPASGTRVLVRFNYASADLIGG